MTEAMLSKVTSKDNAQNLAKKADAAAKILGGLGPYVLSPLPLPTNDNCGHPVTKYGLTRFSSVSAWCVWQHDW